MTRITPRTCLWPLTISLILTFALSLGLTFQSDRYCYAATCGEWLFPLQARLHVVLWYLWISISVTFLAIRAFSPKLRGILRYPLLANKLPYLGKQLTLSGGLLILWVALLYASVVGNWWIPVRDYFVIRGQQDGVSTGNGRLAAIALTGHFCDVSMGMVLLPISRHSALSSFFKLSVSTTLAFHTLMAYTLFALVLIHGFLYVSWLPVFHQMTAQLRMVFPVLNPTYLYHETWPGNTSSLGIWRASLVFSGLFVATTMCLIFVTSFPTIRAKHFNIFYFTHLLIILAIIVVCLHASTMFYCIAPGLVMWLLDWSMRLYELRKPLSGQVASLGNGWYCVSVLLPRHRLQGCACDSPLAHFYIHHSKSSIRELHPFTTITHLASENRLTPQGQDDLSIQFLFRKRGRPAQPLDPLPSNDGFAAAVLRLFSRTTPAKLQWTAQLADLADSGAPPSETQQIAPQGQPLAESSPGNTSNATFGSNQIRSFVDIDLRLEGPYFTPVNPALYCTVICLVAGSGISGAIAIAGAFAEHSRPSDPNGCDQDGSEEKRIASSSSASRPRNTWRKCVIVWSVREDDYIALPSLQQGAMDKLEVKVRLTGNARPRMDMNATLREICAEQPGSTWAYISGPTAFVTAGEEACQGIDGLEYFGARW